MARKEHDTVGIEISIVGSRVVGEATGIGLYMHSRDLVLFDFDKRSSEDLREHGWTTAETLEAVQRLDVNDFGYLLHGRQAYRPYLLSKQPRTDQEIEAIQTMTEG